MPDPADHILEILSRCKRVLITTHVRPDGDALGCSAAMAVGLKQKGIAADILLLSHLPRKYSFVFDEAGLKERGSVFGVRGSGMEDAHLFSLDPNPEPRDPNPDTLALYDSLLVLDTGTWSQLPGLKERIENWPKPKIVIDHHLTQQEWADAKLVDTAAGACAEIIAELLPRFGVEIDKGMAMALFVAIVTDTGWFMFSNTRPITLRTAARLMEIGVDTDRLYQLLYQNERAERVALQTRALNSLELLDNGRIAVMRVRKQDFIETNAHINDTENLINIPLQIRSVEVSVLFSETPASPALGARDSGLGLKAESAASTRTPNSEPRTPTPPIRVSLRSKGLLDVAKFAEQFGGGGHARASGLKLETSLDEAHDMVVKKMLEKNAE